MVSFLLPRELDGLAPPAGMTPDFTNPLNRNMQIYIVTGFCVSIVTVLILLRTYTRFLIIKQRGWQDYLILLALPFSLFYMLKLLLDCKVGIGVHQCNVTIQNLAKIAQGTNTIIIIYCCAVCLIKLAILTQLAHIFTPLKSKMYWVICMVSAFTVMLYVAFIIERILQCIPREKIWNPTIPGKCINAPAEMISSAVINTLSDFIILIIPLSMVSRIQMPRRKKWAVSALFSTGLFCCISSIMRLVASVDFRKSEDQSRGLLNVALWAEAEMTSGIVCCCLPVLPQFYRTHISGFVTSLRTRLSNSTADTVIGPDGLRGDSSSTREPKSMPEGRFPRTRHTSMDLKRPLVGNDDVTAPGGGGTVFLRTENIKAGNGGWDEDVEMGRIRAINTIQVETHIV